MKLFTIEIDLSKCLRIYLERLLRLAEKRRSKITVVGGQLTLNLPGHVSITTNPTLEDDMNRNFTLPNNTPNSVYELARVDEIKDEEGEVISNFAEAFTSSNPEVVQLNPLGDRKYEVVFGKSGSALVSHSVKTKVGRDEVVSTLHTDTFIITTGQALTITGGGGALTAQDGTPIEPDPVEPTPET